jgi:hypothetical protein
MLLAISSSLAVAQTTAPGTAPGTATTAPEVSGGVADWWWVIVLVIVVAVAVWYFRRPKRI